MAEFTTRQKIAEIERELGWRRKVYPGLIAKEKLTREQADRYNAILQAIIQDYTDEIAVQTMILSGGTTIISGG